MGSPCQVVLADTGFVMGEVGSTVVTVVLGHRVRTTPHLVRRAPYKNKIEIDYDYIEVENHGIIMIDT